MTPDGRDFRWSLLLTLALLVFLTLMFRQNAWEYWGIRHLTPVFTDMHAILAASDAHRDGYNAFLENPYDPRVHIYSRFWLWIGYLGLTREHTLVAGSVLVFLFLMTAVIILRPRNRKEFAASAILLFSPAMMLGVERANNDLVIFIVSAAAVFFLFSRVIILNCLSYFIFFVAGALKFYPFAAYAFFIRHIENRRRFWMVMIGSVLAYGVILWWTYPDFIILNKTVVRPHLRFVFGASVLFFWLFFQWPIPRTPYLFSVCLSFCLAFLISRKTRFASRHISPISTAFFMTGSLLLLFCFFAIPNYDYRCIFFVFTAPYFFENLRSADISAAFRRVTKVYSLSLTMVLWSELPLSIVPPAARALHIQHLNDGIIYSIILMEHAGAWVAMSILMILNMELFRPALYDKFGFFGPRSR